MNYNFCKHCLLGWYTQPLHILCTAHCINLWNSKTEVLAVTYIIRAISTSTTLTKHFIKDKLTPGTVLLETEVVWNKRWPLVKLKPPHLVWEKIPYLWSLWFFCIQQSCTRAHIPTWPKRTRLTQTSKASMICSDVFSPCIKCLATFTTISIYQCL